MKDIAEQSRLRDLLTDTITLLCKNGLTYSEECSVDGLIGITLDKQDVFLVSIKEILKLAQDKNDDKSSDNEADSYTNSKNRHGRKRRNTDEDEASEAKYSKGNTSVISTPSKSRLQLNPLHDEAEIEEEQSKTRTIKTEPSNDDDCVYIKQEQDTTWNYSIDDSAKSAATSNLVFSGGSTDSDFSLPAVSAEGRANEPTGVGGFISTKPAPLLPPPQVNLSTQSLVFVHEGTGNNFNYTPNSGHDKLAKGYIQCTICMKLLKGKQGLQRHLQGAHKMGTHYTCACSAIFTWEWSYKQHKKKCKTYQLEQKQLEITGLDQ